MTEPDIQNLRVAFASRDGDRPGAACPAPDRIFDAAGGGLTTGERLAVIDHLVRCPSCAQAWQVAVAIAPASRGRNAPAAAVESGLPQEPRRSAGWAVLAAAAVLVLSVGVVLNVDRSAPEPGFRDVGDARGATTDLDGGSLARANLLLRWQSDAPEATWQVRVLDAQLQPLFTAAGLTVTQVQVPAEAVAGVAAGEQLLWQVETRLPGGEILQSPTWSVTLR